MARYYEENYEHDQEDGDEDIEASFEKEREDSFEKEMETPDVGWSESIDLIGDSEKRINEKRIAQSLVEQVDELFENAHRWLPCGDSGLR